MTSSFAVTFFYTPFLVVPEVFQFKFIIIDIGLLNHIANILILGHLLPLFIRIGLKHFVTLQYFLSKGVDIIDFLERFIQLFDNIFVFFFERFH